MKITAIKAWWLQVPIPEARQHVSDYGRHTSFDTALVRVETDAGITGHGEAKAVVAGHGVYGALVGVILRDLAPSLIGRDPRDPARLWEEMYNGSRAQGARTRNRPHGRRARDFSRA